MTDDDGFCPHCQVANGLHDGPDTCASAEAKAELLAASLWGVVR